MKKVINHPDAVKLLGYKHESEIQTALHDFRNVINASDVINVVIFLTSKGYHIEQSTSRATALKEREDEIKRLKELFNIVFNIDGMTTSEFCAEYLIELPTWKGDVSLAASEFIRIDAIKWKIIKDAAKEIWNTPTDLTVQNGKD